jgi:hypothetical protein
MNILTILRENRRLIQVLANSTQDRAKILVEFRQEVVIYALQRKKKKDRVIEHLYNKKYGALLGEMDIHEISYIYGVSHSYINRTAKEALLTKIPNLYKAILEKEMEKK